MNNIMNTADQQQRWSTDQKIAGALGMILTVIFAVAALWVSINLLSWAMDHKAQARAVPDTAEVTVAVRERQLDCLARNIYYESGGEPFEGKVAVAQVTLNRVKSSQFPDDICRVIYQKSPIMDKVVCQFSWTCSGVTKVKPANGREYEESMAVAKKVLLEGFRLPSLEQALYFHGDYINPGWKRTKVAHIGRHIFYK
jgi:spore germination cell wall hydrolase CwlJ-like protein